MGRHSSVESLPVLIPSVCINQCIARWGYLPFLYGKMPQEDYARLALVFTKGMKIRALLWVARCFEKNDMIRVEVEMAVLSFFGRITEKELLCFPCLIFCASGLLLCLYGDESMATLQIVQCLWRQQ